MTGPVRDWRPCERCEATVAERRFLAASAAVWREIDRLTADGATYPGIDASTDLRKRERAAWEAYRDAIDSAAVSAQEEP